MRSSLIWVAFKYNGQLAADQLTDDPALKPSDVVKKKAIQSRFTL